eukprot:TRINITY_DN59489_c0_g1_i2.p2 TRINITY_DN59489_c0_g1~~TRINITY_DN59489_c0_g1_i2.p2  ORF type:complete len:115 (-),score=3.43 TRINITY_DN59489_c0_g1_i2:515-859(-)
MKKKSGPKDQGKDKCDLIQQNSIFDRALKIQCLKKMVVRKANNFANNQLHSSLKASSASVYTILSGDEMLPLEQMSFTFTTQSQIQQNISIKKEQKQCQCFTFQFRQNLPQPSV